MIIIAKGIRENEHDKERDDAKNIYLKRYCDEKFKG